jgi:hypothetical protein
VLFGSLLFAGGFLLSLPKQIDIIEYNQTDKYEQVILWEWNPRYRRHDAIEWWLVNGRCDLPTRTYNGWVVKSPKGKLYTTKIYNQTQTNYDPEYQSKKLQGKK